jgi:hypothetical protein
VFSHSCQLKINLTIRGGESFIRSTPCGSLCRPEVGLGSDPVFFKGSERLRDSTSNCSETSLTKRLIFGYEFFHEKLTNFTSKENFLKNLLLFASFTLDCCQRHRRRWRAWPSCWPLTWPAGRAGSGPRTSWKCSWWRPSLCTWSHTKGEVSVVIPCYFILSFWRKNL